MTQSSWPFENADTTEAQYSQLFRRLQSTGVWGSPSTTDLKTIGDSTGMQVKVPAGYALVRGHMFYSDAQVTLAIAAANATNPRIDTVVLRLDPTANTIVLAVKTGTAAATPSAPTLTQTDTGTWEVAIANVAVGANATTIAAGNVTDVRPFMGTQFGVWTTSTRPASPAVPTAGFNTTTALPEYWSGSAWVGFTAAITASMITAAEQANINAGKIRSGGTSAGTAIRIYSGGTQPYPNGDVSGVTGDLWFA